MKIIDMPPSDVAEIREVLLWGDLPPCVERRVVCGGCALAAARDWHGYGFRAGEVEAWIRVGVYEPPVAAELRAEGWGATSWPFRDLEFAGLIVGIALSDGHLRASEVRDLVEGREL